MSHAATGGTRDDVAPGQALILRKWALCWLGAGMLFCGCQEATTTPIPTPVDSADTERREREQEALTAFYRATNGADWTNDTGWLTDAPPGAWYGVVVDDDGGVTGLRLPENQLSGEISPELASLANLTALNLRGNRLSIWAYGLRNPWRMAFDPATGTLWAGDVGRSEVEEINHIEASGNYG